MPEKRCRYLNDQSGLAFGQSIGRTMLASRSADGSSTTVPYIPGTQPGDWRRTAPFFRPPELTHWAAVAPFALEDPKQITIPGPPALNSPQYLADFQQVKSLGDVRSVARTPEQTTIARFWSDFSYTVTPPGHWNQIAQNIAESRQNSVVENARLFALLNIAMADAGIVAWDAKYLYNFWRPITAIREAASDGNPETIADPDWTPLLNTPPFPEYISGHSTFSAAAAGVISNFYGTDALSFTITSDTLPGTVRSYESLSLAAEEIGLSRIYGGIHFLSGDLDALAAGHQIGDYVFEHYLQPIPEPGTLSLIAFGTALFLYLKLRRRKVASDE